jgi:hypothetical protein
MRQFTEKAVSRKARQERKEKNYRFLAFHPIG